MAIYVARQAPIALSASATRTVLYVKAGTLMLKVKEIGISFNATDTSLPPVQVDVLYQTSDGTGGTAITPVSQYAWRATPVFTAKGDNWSVEPTSGNILRSWYITPAAGLWVMQFPLGDEPIALNTERIGIRCITGALATPSVTAYFVVEE